MRNTEEMEGFDGEAPNTSMMPVASSPYQPTTEPVHSRNILGEMKCDTEYLKSSFGILKIIEVVLSFIAFICIETISLCSPCGGVYLYEFVSCCALIVTSILLLIYCLKIHTKVPHVNWSLVDLFNAAGSSLLFLFASIILVSLNHKTGAEITAVTFGFLATAVYACDAYLAVRRWRASEGSPGAAHTGEYVRARSTSRGEMQAHPEPQ